MNTREFCSNAAKSVYHLRGRLEKNPMARVSGILRDETTRIVDGLRVGNGSDSLALDRRACVRALVERCVDTRLILPVVYACIED
jgi:hypothetical protein